MSEKYGIRHAIREEFEPWMVRKGFQMTRKQGSTSVIFRKTCSDKIRLCDIQWDKYGKSRFVMNFGCCSIKGIVTWEGRMIMPEDMYPSWSPVWGRLTDGFLIAGLGWFRLDPPWYKWPWIKACHQSPAVLIARLKERFIEVEEFWETGKNGPHIRIYKNPLAKDVD